MNQGSLILLSALFVLSSPPGVAQMNPTQKAMPSSTNAFDVSSIRESKPVPPFSVSGFNPPHAGRFSATNYTAIILIQIAYGVTYTQISEAPDWVHSTRFEIRAQADPSIDDRLAKLSDEDARLEKQHMLQNLLADRFKLKVHIATKKLPAYALVIAKNGTKLHKATIEDSDPAQPHAPKAHPIEERPNTLGSEYLAHGASMELLAAHLTGRVGMTVVDRTGLSGLYDFTLQCCGTDQQSSADWPSIFTALPEQLGLRLQPIKDPISYLVIDHIEKPDEN